MNGHFTCNRREKRLLIELSSTGGKKKQFETVLITNYLMSSIKKLPIVQSLKRAILSSILF